MFSRKMGILSMIIVFGIGIAIVIISLVNSPSMPPLDTKRNFALFFWGIDDVNFEEFDEIVEGLQIETIYVGGASPDEPLDFTSEQFSLMFAHAKQNELKMYIIYDKNYSDFEQNQTSLKELIDKVDEYNQNSYYKLSGVAVDWEFYTTDEYKNTTTDEERVTMFEDYVDVMKTSYSYAKQKKQSFVGCIPTFYDKLSENCLDDLIKNGCDYVQLMNYEKANMIENMAKEMEIAKKYGKHIETIAELQKPTENHGGITDEITFYNDGIDKCQEKFNQIEKHYNYEELSFCYHYYDPLYELVKDELN
ncbi:MAG: hypothetical protein K2K31_03015 [Clostridia bacterium]|nr:hypothetical protein [Clostridia bacterium]